MTRYADDGLPENFGYYDFCALHQEAMIDRNRPERTAPRVHGIPHHQLPEHIGTVLRAESHTTVWGRLTHVVPGVYAYLQTHTGRVAVSIRDHETNGVDQMRQGATRFYVC